MGKVPDFNITLSHRSLKELNDNKVLSKEIKTPLGVMKIIINVEE